jgi:protease-4
MRRFVIGFFALIGILVVSLVALGIGVWYVAKPGAPTVAGSTILQIDLTTALPEAAPANPLTRLIGEDRLSLRDAIEALERAGGDSRVKGVIARVGDGEFGLAQVQELRDAIAAFRATGKPAIAYSDSFGEFSSGTRSYYLASAFDEIWLQPLGLVGLIGLRSEQVFFRGALDKLGLVPRFDHRSEYKTAMNMLTETSMTPPHREEIDAVLRSVFNQIVRGIAEGRKLKEADVRAVVDRGPLLTDEAVQAKLIDHVGYLDEAVAALRAHTGGGATLLSLTQYASRTGRLHRSGPTIALIHADGLIQRGESAANPLTGNGVLGADTVARAFRKAVRDPEVRAILLRIDSPGGSAVASESIWRETLRARQAGKPVIVSMANVAGSGGYYIAAAADKIVAQPATLTGSIGVVAGKVLVDGLAGKLGVSFDAAQIGKDAAIFSPVEDFSPEALGRFEAFLDQIYAGFKQRVAEGRKLDADAVERVARGRVWSGEDAKARGLVDELGGYATALGLAKAAAGIAADQDISLKEFPPPADTAGELIARLLGREADPEDRAPTALAGLARSAALLQPILQRVELLLAPSGTLVMPPVETR